MPTRGTRGEKSFSLLCSDAGLICNFSNEDLAGWDFFVQFPPDKNYAGPSDRRPPAVSAFFQVKTSKTIIDSVCIKLSNAERMAREPKPTFFAFGRDLGEDTPITLELAHIGQAAIIQILAALRKNDTLPFHKRKRNISIHRSFLEMEDASNPNKLKTAVLKYSSSNIEDYIRNKILTIKTVGYNNNSFTSNFSLHGAGADDRLISLMIGEVSELQVQDFSITETRFGISLPIQEPKAGVLRMEPSSKEYGIVEFIDKSKKHRAEFSCEVRAAQAPWIGEDQFKIRISNDIFSFVFSPTHGFSNWRSDPDTRMHLEWDKLKNMIRFLHICTRGPSHMNVYLRDSKAIEAEFSFSMKSNWRDNDLIATISAIDFMHELPALRPYLRLSGSEFVKLMNNKSALFTLLKNRHSQDLQISCTLSHEYKGRLTDTRFLFPFGFVATGQLLAMLLIVEGSASIKNRNVKMPVQRITLEAFGVYPDRKAAIKSLKIYASNYGKNAPDDALIVVEPEIYAANNNISKKI